MLWLGIISMAEHSTMLKFSYCQVHLCTSSLTIFKEFPEHKGRWFYGLKHFINYPRWPKTVPRARVICCLEQQDCFDGDLFDYNPRLRHIDFDQNLLQHVGFNLMSNLHQLEMADFNRNPLHFTEKNFQKNFLLKMSPQYLNKNNLNFVNSS